VYAIKGASKPNRPVLSAKPTPVEVHWQGKTLPHGAQLWHIGTDTAKDYFASRYKLSSGFGATHFSSDLPEEYYKQLTAEFRVTKYKGGRAYSVWDIKKGDRNEAGDLMNYNLAAAHYLGLHKKTANQWQMVRNLVDPETGDLFEQPAPPQETAAPETPSETPARESSEPWPKPIAQEPARSTPQRRPAGRQW